MKFFYKHNGMMFNIQFQRESTNVACKKYDYICPMKGNGAKKY